MRTGKQVSKYYKYVPIWTLKILDGAEGYSVEKAYAIDMLFGSLVEKGVRLMQLNDETLAALARESSMLARIIECTQGWMGHLKYAIKMYQVGKMDIEEVADAYDQYVNWFWLMSGAIAADNKTAAAYQYKFFTDEEKNIIKEAQDWDSDQFIQHMIEGGY